MSADVDEDFRSIAIVGLGLIGGSLALAIRERWPDVTIAGVDRADVLAEAVARSIITRGAPNAAALASAPDIDLVVLAAPVLQNIACLRDLAAAATRPLLVTDVGSTKQAIVSAARELAATPAAARPPLVADDGGPKQAIVTAARDLGPQLIFVGGHPIAGAAHAGLAHARADLFRGRPWILTPDAAAAAPTGGPASFAASEGASASPNTSHAAAQRALARLRAFVGALGAEPAVLSAEEHDRVMAYVSHLPQLVSSALMRTVGDAVGAAGLALSGPGLADTTRLASSSASVWTDILQSNAAHVRAALDAIIADLRTVRDQLDTPAASDWLDAAARWRAHLRNGTRID